VCSYDLTPWHIGNVDCQTLDLAATEPVVALEVREDSGALIPKVSIQVGYTQAQDEELLVLSAFIWCAIGNGMAWNER
jgi:hypothetical protein